LREIKLWRQDGVLEAPHGISGHFYATSENDRIEQMSCFALGWHFEAKGGRFSANRI
jgi:hypothetical protein